MQWKQEHRFVAVRRPIALETEEIQQRLFTFKQYTYHRALVTNLELTPPAVWRFYCNRGFQDLLLREFKGSYAMAKIPTRSFWANAAYMEMILWAYDLILAFQFLCLPKEIRHWNIGHVAQRTLVAPGALGQTRKSQRPVAPSKVSAPRLVSENSNCRIQLRPII
jgi:hypothetical protein